MSFRKILIRLTFRFLKRRNKLFAPIVFFGWIFSFLRWLTRREKKSNSSIERLAAGENISISHNYRPKDSDADE